MQLVSLCLIVHCLFSRLIPIVFWCFFAQIPIGVPSRNPVLPGPVQVKKMTSLKSKIPIIRCYQCIHTNAINNMCTVNLLVIHKFTSKTHLLSSTPPKKYNMQPQKNSPLNLENHLNQTIFLDHFWAPAVTCDAWAKSDGCAVTGVSCANSLNEQTGSRMVQKLSNGFTMHFQTSNFINLFLYVFVCFC